MRLVEKFLAAQVLFVAGAGLGRLIAVRAGTWRRPVLLGGVAVLLAVAALAGGAGAVVLAFVTAVLGMGMQNSVMHAEAGVPVGSMVTGTLVRLGENIVDRLSGRPAPLRDNAGQWVGFVGGAVLGALAYGPARAWAFTVPAVAYALLALATARCPGVLRVDTPPPHGLRRADDHRAPVAERSLDNSW